MVEFWKGCALRPVYCNGEIVLSVYYSQIKLEDDLEVAVFQAFSVFLVLLPIDSIEILNYDSIQIVKVYTKSSFYLLSLFYSILFRLIS